MQSGDGPKAVKPRRGPIGSLMLGWLLARSAKFAYPSQHSEVAMIDAWVVILLVISGYLGGYAIGYHNGSLNR